MANFTREPVETLTAFLNAAVDASLIPRSGRVATVRTSRGIAAVIDEEDLSWVMRRRWHVHKSGKNLYLCTAYSPHLHVALHSHMLRSLPGSDWGGPRVDVHHRDGDSLNDRRNNLQYLLHSTNVALGVRAKRASVERT